jgi:pimeloyl-ACP methyl ester carboxylesterase
MRRSLEANGVELCVEEFGDASHPALLRIGGLSGSMDWWRTEFCERLATGGLRVIRYDHRDTGESVHSPAGAPDYTGADVVADILGLLDALGIPRAHLAGASMGGALAMAFATGHAERVATLTLMSTSTAGDHLPPPEPKLLEHFKDPPPTPDWSDRDAVIDYTVADHRAYAGALGFDEDEVRATAAIVVDRTRDMEAAMTNHSLLTGDGPPLRPDLISAPTLVIHGSDDPLFPLPHGEALARAIPGARLLVIDGMGHEVPPSPVWDEVIGALLEHTRAR